MKYLSQFSTFDFERFSFGKVFLVISTSDWKDYQSKKILGTSVDVVVISDNTIYSDGETGSNRYERLRFKVKKHIDVQPDTCVAPINAVAKIYGDYNNLLSVVCDDIRVIEPTKGQK